MSLTKKLFSCLLLTAALPATAFADIKFTNYTSSDVMTFKWNGLCSSRVPGGAIQPNGGNYTLQQLYVSNSCNKECIVNVFASNNCEESKKIATATIKTAGIVSVNKSNSNYEITYSNTQASIKNAGALGWFKSMFG